MRGGISVVLPATEREFALDYGGRKIYTYHMSVTRLIVMESAGDNVFVNQALEAALFECVDEGECALYLWSNADTVVIGRNQDAYAECRVDALESAGGRLARRLSGGGAVWHDCGNLNYTFISCEKEEDKDRNFSIVTNALASLGIRAETGGRNDLTVNGAKFGGSAYYRRGGKALHHGTVMVHTSADAVARYLTPPSEKFEGKAVKSVRSRVAPLDAAAEDVAVRGVADALKTAFAAAYPGAEMRTVQPVSLGADKVMRWTEFFSRDEWRYGRRGRAVKRLNAEVFGERAVLCAVFDDNGFAGAELTSDSLNADAVSAVNALLAGRDIAEFSVCAETAEAAEKEAEKLRARLKEEGFV